jgi:phage baseplate assembly protein gpV
MGVSYGQSMRVVSGVVRQKFRRLVDGHVINSTLHWAKEMVVKVGDMDSLVNHNVINLTGHRVIIGKRTTNGGIGLSAEGGVISFDNNGSVIIKQNKGITS